MTFDDEQVHLKLTGLNETQDSIVTVAQWVIYHK